MGCTNIQQEMQSEACICVRSLSDPMSKKWKCSRSRHSSGCAQAFCLLRLQEGESKGEKNALLLKKRKTSSLTLYSWGGGKCRQPLTSLRVSDIHHVVYSCRSVTWHLVSLRRWWWWWLCWGKPICLCSSASHVSARFWTLKIGLDNLSEEAGCQKLATTWRCGPAEGVFHAPFHFLQTFPNSHKCKYDLSALKATDNFPQIPFAGRDAGSQ